ncbi:holo-ACP synthase [Tepiditoga spiralis]|uniref:Holo-[acyl-carrier-protein] synthase n=1 Tax=Tepiditoga spiralis TaxID=2108365 RepID=A0A7G1G9Z8_9BACT|nr:holo-ACP synthase [Tepiditoga spiralis]BBE31853.1 holo-ACP synthase [Tepiditoga spiralis]
MILGIGTDIVKISRLNIKLLNKILTESEREICKNYAINRKLEFAAGRFAVKESLTKAFKIFIPMDKISVLKDDNEVPYLSKETHKYLKNKFGNVNINISISHEKEYAIAMVIVEKLED